MPAGASGRARQYRVATVSRTDLTITDWRRDPWDEPDEVEPEELEPLPPERKGGRRLRLGLLGIVVVLCLLAGAGRSLGASAGRTRRASPASR